MGEDSNGLPHEPTWRRGLDAIDACPRCGAKTRSGQPCRRPVRKEGLRCRMHGGASTGSKTHEGRRRQRRANLVHGRRSVVWRRAEQLVATAWANINEADWSDEETQEAIAGEMFAASLGAQIMVSELVEDVAAAQNASARTP